MSKRGISGQHGCASLPTPTDAKPGELRTQMAVVLGGLQRSPEHNGKVGMLGVLDAAKPFLNHVDISHLRGGIQG
jgi:hypothetical protein